MKAAALLLACCACTNVRLITDYDQVLDQRISALAERTESFLADMEASSGTPPGTYEQNRAFYRDAKATIAALRLRTEAAGQAELLTQHLQLLDDNIENLRKLHEMGQEGGLKPIVLGPARDALRAQFRAIQKLEMELRRGA